MGERGPVPTPSNLRLLRGSRPQQLKPTMALLVRDLPPPRCPPELSADAKKEWRRVVPTLISMGVVCCLDVAILAAYCQSVAFCSEAAGHLQAEGTVYTSPRGRQYESPWLKIQRMYRSNVLDCAKALGLTPASRLRLAGAAPVEKRDEAEEFLSGG